MAKRFFLNIPFGIAGILLVRRYLARDARSARGVPFDWLGTLLQSVVLLMVFVFFEDPQFGSAFFRWLLAFMMIAVTALFIRVESRARAPLFDLSLMKIRIFWTSNLAALLIFVALSSVSVLMPFYLEDALHLPPHIAGIFMTAIPLTILVVAPLSGRLSDRFGCRGLSVAGALVGAVDLLAMAGEFGPGLTGSSSSYETHAVVLSLAAMGLALGLFQSPNNNAIMGAVPVDKIGVASALLATVRNLGLAIGTSFAMGIFSWKMTLTHGNFIGSLHFTHLLAAGVALLATFAAFGKGPKVACTR